MDPSLTSHEWTCPRCGCREAAPAGALYAMKQRHLRACSTPTHLTPASGERGQVASRANSNAAVWLIAIALFVAVLIATK